MRYDRDHLYEKARDWREAETEAAKVKLLGDPKIKALAKRHAVLQKAWELFNKDCQKCGVSIATRDNGKFELYLLENNPLRKRITETYERMRRSISGLRAKAELASIQDVLSMADVKIPPTLKALFPDE